MLRLKSCMVFSAGAMSSTTPQGDPQLSISAARQFALDRIAAALSQDPALANEFLEEISGSTPPAQPDITVFYCFVHVGGASFSLLEFVSGQTLEQLCTGGDIASVERIIPLF